jgi:SAM-dependent methyltransferase
MNHRPFDGVGGSYDEDFTATLVGRAQRAQVWRYLDRSVLTSQPMRVLDLGCGTGEDAVGFARRGHVVTAMDRSGGMLSVAREKAASAGVGDRVRIVQADLREPGMLSEDVGFDLVFSNFGALNCLSSDDLSRLAEGLARVVEPGGRLVVVIMPRGCLWERVYFSVRGPRSQARRRCDGGPVEARVGHGTVTTWYHRPRDVVAAMAPHFARRGVVPVGLAVPPSYLDPLIARRPRMAGALQRIDRLAARVRWSANWADHALIDLVRSGTGS